VVVDLLGLITTDWRKLKRWRSDPGTFTVADWQQVRDSGVTVFHPAVELSGGDPYRRARNWMDQWKRFAGFHPEKFEILDSLDGFEDLRRRGRVGILLGMQNSNHFTEPSDVAAFSRFGQRISQLTYNLRNRIGDGCYERRNGGLTPFGIRIVEAMRRAGMLIDISHCGRKTSIEAVEAAGRGVVISHSNCRFLVPGEQRCKSDELIRKVAASGGTVGITAIAKFVHSSRPVTLDHVLDHFDHIARLVGVEHITLGTDAGIDGHESYIVPGLADASRVYQLTDGLLRRGYSKRSIQLILGGNAQRVFGELGSQAGR
jgi:membrane dipeptidase